MSIIERIYSSSPRWMQNIMCSAKGWAIQRRRYGKDFFKYLRLFETRQINPTDALHDFLESARFIPAYNKTFRKRIGGGGAESQRLPDY